MKKKRKQRVKANFHQDENKASASKKTCVGGGGGQRRTFCGLPTRGSRGEVAGDSTEVFRDPNDSDSTALCCETPPCEHRGR